MIVLVKKGDVVYPCKTDEQLANFLSAGYVKVEEPKEEPQETTEKPKKRTKKQ